MLDFTDVGLSSTYRQPMIRVEQVFEGLVSHAGAPGSEDNLTVPASSSTR